MPSCTFFVMDTSDHMRNGDYEPTRLDAQQAAVRLLIDTRLSRGPENYVGLVTTGTAVKVRAPATDQEELLAESIRGLRAGGTADFVSAMKVARLALHNRTNKAGDARIVAFVGSPVTAPAKDLKRLASQLRGINIGVDVVLVGEDAATRASLETFVQAVGKDRDNSCVVAVPPGRNLADALFSSPVTRGHDAGAAGAAAGGGAAGGGGGGGGDAELQEALRASLAMSQQQQAAPGDEGTADGGAGSGSGGGATGGGAGGNRGLPADINVALLEANDVDLTQDPAMLRAIQFSLQEMLGLTDADTGTGGGTGGGQGGGVGGAGAGAGVGAGAHLPADIDVALLQAHGVDLSEDVALLRAIQETLQDVGGEAAVPSPAMGSQSDGGAAGAEGEYDHDMAEADIMAMMADLDGVDMSDPDVAAGMRAITEASAEIAAEQGGAASGEATDSPSADAGSGGAAKRPRRDGGGDADADEDKPADGGGDAAGGGGAGAGASS